MRLAPHHNHRADTPREGHDMHFHFRSPAAAALSLMLSAPHFAVIAQVPAAQQSAPASSAPAAPVTSAPSTAAPDAAATPSPAAAPSTEAPGSAAPTISGSEAAT